eukprot:s1651_g5.t1
MPRSFDCDADFVNAGLVHRVPVDSMAKNLQTPLMWAVLRGHVAVARQLLAAKASLTAKDSLGATALMIAVQHKSYPSILLLMHRGHHIQAQMLGEGDKNGCTPAHWAAYKGDLTALKLLHYFKADLQVLDSAKMLPLHRAVCASQGSVVEFLVEHKSDLQARNHEGKSCMDIAAEKNDLHMQALLKRLVHKTPDPFGGGKVEPEDVEAGIKDKIRFHLANFSSSPKIAMTSLRDSAQVVGAASPDLSFPTATSSSTVSPDSPSGEDVEWELDFHGLWEGGWEELLREDADQIGEAYQASILGGILGAEEEKEIADEIEMNEGFKESTGHREVRKDKHKMSAKGLISNFVLTIVGTTTLGLSSQMPKLGWILPPLSVVMGCLIVSENTRLVTATMEKLQREQGITILAYPDFAKGAFGIWGKRISSVTSMLALVGMLHGLQITRGVTWLMCTGYVLETHNFNFLFPITWSWFGCNLCGHKWWAVILLPVTLAYVFGNPGALMKRVAFVGPFVCVLTVAFAWIGAGSSITAKEAIPEPCRTDASAEVGPGGCLKNGGSKQEEIGRSQHVVLPSFSDLFSMGMILELAVVGSYGFWNFAVIVTVPTLRNQMKNPKKTLGRREKPNFQGKTIQKF